MVMLEALDDSRKFYSKMSNGERIPRLAVGPYHQRPAPILTDTPFVNGSSNFFFCFVHSQDERILSISLDEVLILS
uniref:FBA_1 domain-containing protein n=1 Tax=Ascaris lumbricoides TaxID=6252 RepID=A0A0M3IL86_ASCLU